MRVGADAARTARRRSSAFRQGSRRSKSRREIRHRTTVVLRQGRVPDRVRRGSHVIIFVRRLVEILHVSSAMQKAGVRRRFVRTQVFGLKSVIRCGIC
jgi:hypothetical protein